ncbi:26S proteasome subunit P45 [Hanseniaspora valbyensis NRRL Y-1626]|uniref:26S proteasome subunit P45 n=1 Tax=Hanseniaspora valbyensis NRRL Y-1626 TaxID=766949 RepID=A0A1B7THA4_9ASCO|nr:26S proteasome subunit P45 [Hanseniaspora valbyensis NRRL Y-1626]
MSEEEQQQQQEHQEEEQQPLLDEQEQHNDVEMEQEEEVVVEEVQLTSEQIAAEEAKRTKEISILNLKKKILQHQKQDEKLKSLRIELRDLEKSFEKTEYDIKALQSIGQLIGEIMKELTPEKYIVKASTGPRYIVGVKDSIDRSKLKKGVRVTLDITTLTIMRILPRETDPLVYNMTSFENNDKSVSFDTVGGLEEEIKQLREVIELPLKNPEIFKRVGIKPPKGVLLYGPPGTGKTLLAKATAATIGANFIFSPASGIVDKYIGESARIIREMFAYAKEHEPCIIFMDEIDAIGGRRFSEGNSADREIQRTLMELLTQMDGFETLGQTKIIMATNRPDTLDPALLRPGRLDRKIEIKLPNEVGRREIFKIHMANVAKDGDFDIDAAIKMSDGFNGADIRNCVTEAGFFAIRDDREYINQDDLMKAIRKVAETKKLETKLEYKKI